MYLALITEYIRFISGEDAVENCNEGMISWSMLINDFLEWRTKFFDFS